MPDNEMAKLLREIREDRGVSVREVARQVGVDPSYVSRVERGEKNASPEFLRRISEHYELPDDAVLLSAGRVPADIAEILLSHLELLAEIRERYRPGAAAS